MPCYGAPARTSLEQERPLQRRALLEIIHTPSHTLVSWARCERSEHKVCVVVPRPPCVGTSSPPRSPLGIPRLQSSFGTLSPRDQGATCRRCIAIRGDFGSPLNPIEQRALRSPLRPSIKDFRVLKTTTGFRPGADQKEMSALPLESHRPAARTLTCAWN